MPTAACRASLLLAFLLLSPVAHAQPVNTAALDGIVQEAVQAWHVPGAAVAIVRDNEVVYLKGFGVRELGKEQPVTADTLFACASTSKAFTALVIAVLVQEGKMSWDDPVRKHIEFFHLSDPLADANVTVRDLLTHRTGLSRNDLLWYASPWDREEVLRRIGRVPLTKSFRSAYQYQNIMYMAAGYAAGKADGSSWEAVLRKRVFDPLGMNGSNFSSKDAEAAADHATPHLRNPEGKIAAIPWRNIDNIGPAGAINASVGDMSRWLRFQLGDGSFEGKRLVSAALLRETHSPQMVIPLDGPARTANPETNLMSYGLGWIIHDYRRHLVVAHGGSIDGFRSEVALVPESKLGLVVFTNLGRVEFPQALRNSLIDHLLDLPKRNWNAHFQELGGKREASERAAEVKREAGRRKDTKPSRELAAYAATFEHPAYGKATIALESEASVLRWSSFTMKLEHFHFDTFTLRGDQRLDKQQVVFDMGANAAVERLHFAEQEFKRIKDK